MRRLFWAVAVWSVAAVAQAQSYYPEVRVRVPARNGEVLQVTIPKPLEGGCTRPSNIGDDDFAGLAWSDAPAATRSFAIIVQETIGSQDDRASLKWSAYNLPPGLSQLEPGMQLLPGSGRYGADFHDNSSEELARKQGLPPPPPPPVCGAPVYHFQVFALDRLLPDGPSPSFEDMIVLMKDHVLASGEVTDGKHELSPRPMPSGG